VFGVLRTVRFHEYGEPADVLHMETAPVPDPGPGRIRVVVHACGLAPADWALCRGLFPGQLPRGIGCDVSGTVDAVGDGDGDGVTDGAVGELVFGTADWAGCSWRSASPATPAASSSCCPKAQRQTGWRVTFAWASVKSGHDEMSMRS
jgi:NADPH:quinone reductase-like Zn-dependent oxidoreductase